MEVKGGTISGENNNPYETVKYGENSTQEIVMTPEEGYEIIGITVNGEEYQFSANEDGTYTMPQFTNIIQNIYVEVTYALKENQFVINKFDEQSGEPIKGVTFRLDQIEERTEPEGEEVIGNLTDNGAEYFEADTSNEVTGVLGPLTDNGTYTFVEGRWKICTNKQ